MPHSKDNQALKTDEFGLRVKRTGRCNLKLEENFALKIVAMTMRTHILLHLFHKA